MKRSIRWAWLVFLSGIVIAVLPPAWTANSAAPATAVKTVRAGYLENVVFERLPGKERVTLELSKQSGVAVEKRPGNVVLIRLKNILVPEELRRALGDKAMANILRVTPALKADEDLSWPVAIELKQMVPYNVRQQGMNILVDFNVTSVAGAGLSPVPEKTQTQLPEKAQRPAYTSAEKAAMPVSAAASVDDEKAKKSPTDARISLDVQESDIKAIFRLLSEVGKVSIVSGDDVKGKLTLNIKDVPWKLALNTILEINGLQKIEKDNVIMVMNRDNYLKLRNDETILIKQKRQMELDMEPLITRVVPIKYRLLTLVGTKKIDIKGEVRASGSASSTGEGKAKAETSSGFAQASGIVQQNKDIASIASVEGKKTERVSLEGAGDFFALLQSFLSLDAYGNPRGWIGADADTNSIIITAIRQDLDKIMEMISKTDVPTDQVLIKAHIVETTKSTARDLGIQWGGAFGRYTGNQSLYITPGGSAGSTVPPGSALSGGYTPTSGTTGVSGQGYGINFPALMDSTASASLGLLFGTIGGNILDLQLSALQKDGKLNILSTPSLLTLDNQPAYTENGDEVPFITPATSESSATVTWKKAGLRLEITPHVIDDKTLSMKILVKKDELDFSREVQGNPVIIQKETKTDLVVPNGETIVISGLTKQKTDNSISGVPWLKETPVLGWLFKGESKNESMEEVMIFITPNIMKRQIVAGVQEGT